MGYCNDHHKVYSGPECPVCSGEGPDVQDAAVQLSDETAAESSGEDGSGDAIDSTVEEAITDAVNDVSVDNEDGDVVIGDKEKEVEVSKDVRIDNSETRIDESEEVHDDRTVVEDSVLKDTDVGTDGPATVKDSVAQDSSVAGGPESRDESEPTRSERRGKRDPSAGPGERAPPAGHDSPLTCPGCGEEVSDDDEFCMQCGTSLQGS